ncbi:MAG: hypothetical protein ACYDHU_03920 [Acidimicrobiales bacterium]
MLVSWISQTFFQLVLLWVIIVGENVPAAAADKRAEATCNDADAVLHKVVKPLQNTDALLAGLRPSPTRRCVASGHVGDRWGGLG